MSAYSINLPHKLCPQLTTAMTLCTRSRHRFEVNVSLFLAIIVSSTTMVASLMRLPARKLLVSKITRQTTNVPFCRSCAFATSVFPSACRPNEHVDSLPRKKKIPSSISTNRATYSSRWVCSFHSHNPDDTLPSVHSSSDRQNTSPEFTVYYALRSSIQLLRKKSIPEPEESALHLLSYVLNLNWETGYRQLRAVMEMTPIESRNILLANVSPTQNLAQQSLTSEQRTSYNAMLERRLQHEPIQYIIGKWDFHHLTGLIIKKPMLCPRPETEELVELVLADVRRLIKERALDHENNKKDKIRILDVGAGTGAIGIALAYQYPKDVQVVALDIIAEAVDLSNRNAEIFLSPLVANDKSEEQIDVRSLYHAILCSAKDFTNSPNVAGRQEHEKQRHRMGFDIVVSNPPYIPLGDMDGLSIDVLQYESREALCGGNDGLDIVRDIIQRLPEWMSCSNRKEASSQTRHCWMEVDDSHPRLLEKWLAPGSEESKVYGVEYCECLTDFCGRDRFVMFRIL